MQEETRGNHIEITGSFPMRKENRLTLEL